MPTKTKPAGRRRLAATTAAIHKDRGNQGRWTMPVTYGELPRAPLATAHLEFFKLEDDLNVYYERDAWWLAKSHTKKWADHLAALRAHPFVVVTASERIGKKWRRRDYVCLARFEPSELVIDEKTGIRFRVVERIEVRQ